MLDSQDSKIQNFEQGFTLVEILVALTLMSMIMISIYSIVSNNIDTKDRVTKEDRDFLQIYLAIDRIEKDLSLLYSPLYFDTLPNANPDSGNNASPINESVPIPRGGTNIVNDFFPQVSSKGRLVPLFQRTDKSQIAFFTSSNRRFVEGQKESHFQWVRYTLDKSEEDDVDGTERLYRQTINQNIYDPTLDLDKARSFLLLKGVKSLVFEYWEPKRERWIDRYDSQKDQPPKSIRLTLEWLGPDSAEDEPEIFTRVIRPYFPKFNPTADLTNQTGNPIPGSELQPSTGFQ